MKKLTKFWGVFLAIVLASTLILSAAPVSAGTLSWGSEDLPDEFALGDSITDMSISGDGSTIYIAFADAGNLIKRSTNGGESWSDILVDDGPGTMVASYIAVTPDDPNYIAAMNTAGLVYISDDAGANWDSLGTPTGLVNVNDLAISVEKGGNHFVAVAGDDGASQAQLFYYEIGAIAAGWTDAWTTMAGTPATDDSVHAVAFSPNFYSDQVMVAVSFDDAAPGEINYSMYSFNTSTWNSGAFNAFPKNLRQGGETLTSMQSGSLALAPDFLGSDDSMRIAFVGLAINGAGNDMESEGIFRMDDSDVEVLKDEEAIKSVAFDGSLLVAGHLEEVTIYRSTDALDGSPSVSSSTGTKEPGGTDTVIVGIAGDTVVAATNGTESAFAYSEDNGKTFNDLSMINSDLTTLNDVAMTPDGSKVYLVTRAASGALSVWSLDERWERIYNDASAGSDYLIRMAPDDSAVVYLAELGGTDMRFSSDGGFGKWQTRVYKEGSGISDLAVETDGDTVYVLTSGGYVSKSSNRGFTWGSKKSSKVTGDSSISCMGEDMVLVGGTDGRVSYSTDGNSTWTKISNDGWTGGANDAKVVATGLADGDFVLAACADGVNAWELGADDEWDDITPSSVNSTMVASGISLVEGVLYVVAYDTGGPYHSSVLARTLTPTGDDPTWSSLAKGEVKFDIHPQGLSGSVDGNITKLWAIDSGRSVAAPPAPVRAPALYSYKDTLATIGVDLSLPADAKVIPFNPVSGASNQIIFSWLCPSDKVFDFDFVIATDTAFNEVVIDEAVTKSSGTWDAGKIISKIVGPDAGGNFAVSFMPDTTYYWRVRVDSAGPVRSAWSETRSFTTGDLPEAQAPVIIQQPPAPVIQVPPTPEIILQPPDIILPAPTPAPEIIIPAAPAPAPAVPQWALLVIIIIGAVLVIALIVLIMRTRRAV